MFTSTAWDCNREAFHVCFVALASFWYLNCRLHGALHVSKAPSESKWPHFGPLSPFEIHGAGRSAVTSWSTQRRKVPASHGPGHKTFTEEKSSSAQKAGVDELLWIARFSFFVLFFSCLLLLGLLMEQTSQKISGVSPLFDVFVSCRFRVHGSFADISYDVVIGGAQPNTTVGFKSCLESWSIVFIPL